MAQEGALGVEVNTFTISPTVVVIAAKSSRIARELEARGIDPIRVDYSEVTRIQDLSGAQPCLLCGRACASMMLGNLAAVRRPMMVP